MLKNDNNKFRKLRKEAGFKTQKELADHLYCHVQSIIKWETGKVTPYHSVELYLRALIKINAMKKMCDYCEKSPKN